jgi:hypothetical protein
MDFPSISRGAQLISLRSVQANTIQKSASRAREEDLESDTKVSISKPAEVLQKLKALQEARPEQLEETLGDVAKQLQQAADNTDGKRSELLSQLASRFAAAAESRDLSGFAQPAPEAARDAGAQQPGLAGRALAAYAKNGPPAKADDVTQRALDAAAAQIDQALLSRVSATVPSSLSSLASGQ